MLNKIKCGEFLCYEYDGPALCQMIYLEQKANDEHQASDIERMSHTMWNNFRVK